MIEYRVGYVDDKVEQYDDYKVRLKRRDIDLFYYDGSDDMNEVIRWILDNSIKTIILDFKMETKFTFTGNQLFTHINGILPDMQCIILSSYAEDSKSDDLVENRLVFDRDILSSIDIDDFCNQLKKRVQIFSKRLEIRKEEFNSLLSKKNEGNINSDDNQKFTDLFRILKSYEEIDDLPVEFFSKEINSKLDDILLSLDKIIKK